MSVDALVVDLPDDAFYGEKELKSSTGVAIASAVLSLVGFCGLSFALAAGAGDGGPGGHALIVWSLGCGMVSTVFAFVLMLVAMRRRGWLASKRGWPAVAFALNAVPLLILASMLVSKVGHGV